MAYPLNDMQAACVDHGEGPLLVLAGAGSGKTGVIVNRIVALMRRGLKPSSICAVTFTNKAAREMRERVRDLVGKSARGSTEKKPPGLSTRGMFIGTFHSLGLMILRENIEKAGVGKNFSILGQDDQLTLAREVLVQSGVDTDMFDEKKLIKAISDWKNSGEAMGDYFADDIWRLRVPARPITEIVDTYVNRVVGMNALDFDDLILLPERLLKHDDEVRGQYRARFSHFLADEFQDTNPLQFRFLSHLMREPFNLCAVGDDDQSIYSWRGADTRIMLEFKQRFPQADIIALEQNYRSEQYILDIANKLIENNTARHPKRLFSERRTPNRAIVFEAADGLAEAEYVADTIIAEKVRHQGEYSAFCVLYRTNFQSRSFEEVLRQRNIPYHVSGSYQFYDRTEIKDVLAYLRFFANHADDRSLSRILNMPKRGISETAIQRLSQYAQLNKKHLWDILAEIEMCEIDINAATLAGIMEFKEFIAAHEHEIRKTGNLAKAAQNLIDALQLEREYVRQGIDAQKIINKLLNVRELMRSIDDFENSDRQLPNMGEGAERNIYTYLQFVALLTADDKENESETPKVQLMTIHQAKGLEFHTVFVTGLEDGILPHQRSIDNEVEANEVQGIEEERRLLYVALTRAKARLYLTLSRTRKNRGLITDSTPSRFLDELPKELLEWESTTAEAGDLAALESMLLNI
ncbi:ATP-dependent helicase [Turneriella parva]|uniref:DNA 3'-5' helicase n=1 Tax=Turneriella parva (strain ATCC BAA-1111 / DSM 21527 / NCTC 11395 / H) TaxID=869212 RepID=I4B8H5_TURPD|nr:UvrD-helicase domain-containing protein [Turneriella parva]AFM13582.1 UvrD/REP helicase [Turneriella parva DSM 21527]